MKWKISKAYHNMEILEYLREVHSFSKRILTGIKFDGGQITVNGNSQKVRYQLQTDDRLSVQFPSEKIGRNLIAEDLPLHIVYEDEDIMVLNKPANVAVMPSENHKTGTIANRILGYYEKQNIPYTVHIVTRLDRDTSGLLLVAKYRYIHSLLARAHESNEIHRKYTAVIEGKLKEIQGVIDAPIMRKEGSIIERTVNLSGKSAITEYNLLKEWKNHSLVEITLKTGRTHQIRVHFSHLGHPLAGDDLYGGSKKIISRQALHCSELIFKHPLTKKRVSYHLSVPDDMRLFPLYE